MSYVIAFLGIAVLIVLHELGHHLAAKATGMRVERFSLFFGPLLVRRRIGETEYGIACIPLGGYAKISGMNPEEELPEEARLAELEADPAADPAELQRLRETIAEVRPRLYCNQPVWRRIVVVAAGPAVNLLVALIVVWGLLLGTQTYVTNSAGAPVASDTVYAVLAGSPAAGRLMPGDRLVSIDGVRGGPARLRRAIVADRCSGPPRSGCRAARPLRVVLERHGHRVAMDLTPRYNASAKRMLLGFDFALKTTSYGPLPAAGRSFSDVWRVTEKTVSTVARIFEPRERRQLHSVVGITAYAQQAVNQGPAEALQLFALVSLALAIINLFPFLPLDGGHIFWALVEKVRGRRVPLVVMERASLVGVALIAALFIVGLSNDITAIANNSLTLPH
jgi:regulator of sigma E protease